MIVLQVSGGKYYESTLVEIEYKELTHTTDNIWIDLGIKDLCIISDGKIYKNLKIIRKCEWQLSHNEKRSKIYDKTKKK